MSHFQEFQRQKEAEAAENNIEGKLILLIICGVFSIPFLFFIPLLFSEDTPSGCVEIGGTYEIVGEEYSPSLKRTIDIYGCVK